MVNIAARRTRQKKLGDLCRYLGLDREKRDHFNPPPEWKSFIESKRVNKTSVMDESTGALGGYLIPVELTIGIEEQLAEFSLFHKLACQQPMVSEECDIGRVDLTAAHATGVTPLIGGLTMSYGSRQGTTIKTTVAAFASNKLVAKNIIADVQVTNQLRNDGGEALGAKLEELFYKAIRWNVERQCLLGVGTVGQFDGIVNAPGTYAVPRQTSATVTILDVSEMMEFLLPACYANAVWMAHSSILKYIGQFTSYSALVPGSNGHPALAGSLLGRPLYVTENLNAVGTQGDIVLFDPTQYVLGTRHMGLDMSPFDNASFIQNLTTYRLWFRGDGQPTVKNTLTEADGTTTAACYVQLTSK